MPGPYRAAGFYSSSDSTSRITAWENPRRARGGGDLVALTGGELGSVLSLHKRAGRLQLGAFAVVCLGKQLLHHIGGGVAVNALGRKIIQNLAAGLALAQQFRSGAAAGKRDIV